MGDFDSIVTLQNKLKEKRICLQLGDYVPAEEELDCYLNSIRKRLDPKGLIIQLTISKKLALRKGKYVEINQDVIETALRILDFFRG